MAFEKSAELDQANVRIIVTLVAIVYVGALGFLPGHRMETYLPVIIYCLLFLIASVAFRSVIVRWPGHYPLRRVLGMVHDYTGTSFGLVVGGEAALALYAVIVWVNLGNGMRFGSRYLAIATALAWLALGVVYCLTPYWQAQPFMVLMLMVTSTLIPGYAHLLLERTRKASEQAAAANREKSRFLAQASHDLRQPIHSIGLFTACLREAQLGDEERRLVDSIDRSLLNVSELFRSILDLYTLDNDRVQPRHQAVHLGELLSDLVRQNAEAARWARVTVRLRPCGHWVLVDATLLATMVQNVLSNCFKYGAGQPLLIGVRKRGAKLAIMIHDLGRGIAQADLAKVFEEFYRVRQRRDNDVEGVGLGLSIVKRLGQLMGVEVAIRSRLGRGTSVCLSGVPLTSPPPRPAQPEAPQQAGLLMGLKVCLIEDDRHVLLATQALLQRWGCSVQSASSGEHLTSDCDVIVAAYDLGNQATGLECIDRLRRQRGQAIPALILTGHDRDALQAQLRDRDIAILAKPVRPAELRSVLRKLWQMRESGSSC